MTPTDDDRLGDDRPDNDRASNDRAKSDQLDGDRLDTERLGTDRLDTERLDTEQLDDDRPETDRLDTNRLSTDPPDDDLQLEPGSIVGGRFLVRRLLGRGGEATVWLAHDRELDLDVVLKTRRFRDAADLELLRREASMLMRIVAHPGLPVVRSDLVEDDRYFMISDHVDGRDLADIAAAQAAGPLPLASVLDLLDGLGAPLDHLHAHRPPVIHGDVKPENVVIRSDGRTVLVDFGASMRAGDGRSRLGTPGFSAPEVLAGEPVSAASDVYSLAAIAVYLLTGLVPKLGAAWPAAMAEGQLARLERVIRRGLTWDPLGRPWVASDFASALRSAAESEIPSGTVTVLLHRTAHASAPTGDHAAAIERAGGQALHGARLPDGVSAHVFSRTSDALGAALELDARAGGRVVIHAGEIGGRHGATAQLLVDDAMALADRATGGGIICSPPVRMLLGDAAGVGFQPLDDELVEVLPLDQDERSDPDALDPAVAVSLSSDRALSWIAARRSSVLAGRDLALGDATVAIDRQRAAAAAAIVLVRGDAGMGKTRFLAELAARAVDAGELVLVGRCTESGGAFASFLDALGDELFPFEHGQLERDEEGWVDRRRFFGRIANALAAQGRAVTLVLDDVQWIDGSSLALLAQLLDDVGPSLAVIAGARPVASPAVVDELLVRPGATAIDMAAMAVDDLAALAAGVGAELDDERLASLHALTAGNPFFAVQLLEHLRRAPAGASPDDVPSGVRDWLRERVERLGADVVGALSTAAVIGRSFDLMVLADVLGASPLEVVDHLDRAVRAGLVVESSRAGSFDFVHAIVQTALADGLSSSRRGLLHAAIAGRIEENGDELEHLEAALHHWLEADRLGDPLHTGAIAARVGTMTTERLAHEQAISVLERSLDVIADAAAGTERDRVEARVRVALGRALFVATRSSDALAQLYRAADLAESADDAETLANAALVASLNRRHGRDDPELLDLLERASDRCPPEPAVLPAMLHIRRSRLLPLSVPHEERSEMARRSLAHVDRMDPVDRAMVETEVARACWEPGDAEDRVAVTTRIIDEATAAMSDSGPSRWTGVSIEALNVRWASLAQLGRLHEALDDATTAVSIADQAGTTFLLSRSLMGEAMLRAAVGQHEDAERLSAQALAISDRHNLVLDSMAIAYCIGRDRGTQQQLAQVERQLGDLVDSNSMFVAAFALVHAEAGHRDDAVRLLDDLDRRAPWPRNWVWLATAVSALESALLVDDAERVARYAASLTPYSGQWAVAAAELGCWGPIDRLLGLAAASAGDGEEARRLLIAARDTALANGAPHWVARCHAGLASLAVPGDSSH